MASRQKRGLEPMAKIALARGEYFADVSGDLPGRLHRDPTGQMPFPGDGADAVPPVIAGDRPVACGMPGN